MPNDLTTIEENTAEFISLRKYLRRHDGSPAGCIVAIGPGSVGLSLCAPKDHKKWDKGLGIHIAVERAFLGVPPKVIKRRDIRDNIEDELRKMVRRSFAYFRG